MHKEDFQELLPIIALFIAVLGGILIVVLSMQFIETRVVLAGVTIIAFNGIYFSGLPPIEYIILLVIAVVLCLCNLPARKYVVILPGIFMGYFWGCWLAEILDRPNVAKQIAEAKQLEDSQAENDSSAGE
ncbi:hypothetical protein ACFL35_05705 [Candidatus Riflebacteria bacterium]